MHYFNELEANMQSKLHPYLSFGGNAREAILSIGSRKHSHDDHLQGVRDAAKRFGSKIT